MRTAADHLVGGIAKNNREALAGSPHVRAVSSDTQYPYFVRRGQRYSVLGTKPYTRLDGRVITLTLLRSDCLKCGEPYETSAGPVYMENERRYLTRRCPDCRQKRKPAARRPKCPHCGQRLPGEGV